MLLIQMFQVRTNNECRHSFLRRHFSNSFGTFLVISNNAQAPSLSSNSSALAEAREAIVDNEVFGHQTLHHTQLWNYFLGVVQSWSTSVLNAFIILERGVFNCVEQNFHGKLALDWRIRYEKLQKNIPFECSGPCDQLSSLLRVVNKCTYSWFFIMISPSFSFVLKFIMVVVFLFYFFSLL